VKSSASPKTPIMGPLPPAPMGPTLPTQTAKNRSR
jgi:hypothetical protein